MFRQIFGTLDLLLAVEIAAQVLLALLLGGLVGYERERRRIPAGVRELHTMVGMLRSIVKAATVRRG